SHQELDLALEVVPDPGRVLLEGVELVLNPVDPGVEGALDPVDNATNDVLNHPLQADPDDVDSGAHPLERGLDPVDPGVESVLDPVDDTAYHVGDRVTNGVPHGTEEVPNRVEDRHGVVLEVVERRLRYVDHATD